MKRRDVIIIAVGVAVLVLIGVVTRLLSSVLVDYWWYGAVGHRSVYVRILAASVVLWGVGFAAGFMGVAIGILIARRRLGPMPVVFYR